MIVEHIPQDGRARPHLILAIRIAGSYHNELVDRIFAEWNDEVRLLISHRRKRDRVIISRMRKIIIISIARTYNTFHGEPCLL